MIVDLTSWGLALAGGMLIGSAATILWLFQQRVAGISGILARLVTLDGPTRERSWRATFMVGLILGGLIVATAAPSRIGPTVVTSPLLLVVAGLAVGVGTYLGNGCTSGHGVCGISRGNGRSLIATVVFMTTAVLTVGVTRLLGVSP